jgi:hypothetical protein
MAAEKRMMENREPPYDKMTPSERKAHYDGLFEESESLIPKKPLPPGKASLTWAEPYAAIDDVARNLYDRGQDTYARLAMMATDRKAAGNAVVVGSADKWLGGMSLPNIVDMFKHIMPELTQYYQLMRTYSATSKGVLDNFALLIKPLQRSRQIPQFNEAASTATYYQVDPSLGANIESQDWYKAHAERKAAAEA